MAYYSNNNKYESLGCIDNPPWLADTNNTNNNNRTYVGFADDNTYNTSAMDNNINNFTTTNNNNHSAAQQGLPICTNRSYTGRLQVGVDKLGLLQFRGPELGFDCSCRSFTENSDYNSGKSDGDDDSEGHDIDGEAVDAAAREMEKLDVAPAAPPGMDVGGDEITAVVKGEPVVAGGDRVSLLRAVMQEPVIMKNSMANGFDYCSNVSGTLPCLRGDFSDTFSSHGVSCHGYGDSALLGIKRSASSVDGMKLQYYEDDIDGSNMEMGGLSNKDGLLSSSLPSSFSNFGHNCYLRHFSGSSGASSSSWWVDLDSPESFLDLQDIDDSWVNSLPPLNSCDLINTHITNNNNNFTNYTSYFNTCIAKNYTYSSPNTTNINYTIPLNSVNSNYTTPTTSANNNYNTTPTTSANSNYSTINSANNSNNSNNTTIINNNINHKNTNVTTLNYSTTHPQNNINIKQPPSNTIHSHNHNQTPSTSTTSTCTTSTSCSSSNNIKAPPRPTNSNETSERKRPKRLDLNEPKYVIITRNYESVLKDGFKWRKYGQKSVKNNIYPRSYYKCSYEGCYVHKHVERVALNPCLILTTYRGRHNH